MTITRMTVLSPHEPNKRTYRPAYFFYRNDNALSFYSCETAQMASVAPCISFHTDFFQIDQMIDYGINGQTADRMNIQLA